MTNSMIGPMMVTAAVHVVARGHRHGGRLIGLVIILAVIAVGVILVMQRRRNRRPLDDGAPAAPIQHDARSLNVGERSDPPVRRAAASGTSGGTAQESVEMNKQLAPGRYGIVGLLRSEWTKLRTVRSTVWTLGITIALGIGVSALATAETSAHWSTMSPSSRLTFDPTGTSLIGIFIGQFALGILGALAVSAEYGTGTIRATFSAAPRRSGVLIAKIIVFGIVALIVAEVVAFVAFFVGQALLTAPATHATLGSPGALREVVGSGLYVGVLGLFSLGLATIIRHTAGAISAFVGILLVLPLIVAALPNSISIDVRRFLPDRIGATMISLHNGSNVFSPWIGFLVLCGYALAALVVGGILLVRRDA